MINWRPEQTRDAKRDRLAGAPLCVTALIVLPALGLTQAIPVWANSNSDHSAVASVTDNSGHDAGANIILAAAGGHGDPHAPKKAKEPEAEPPIPKSEAIDRLPPADQYCARVGDIAATSQFAKQRQALAKAQEDVEARIKTLTEKSEELQAWHKKREDFLKKATDSLLAIYVKMKPDVAATQLVAMNHSTAAAIVAKLPPKAASAILAEMEPQRAARLSSVLAGAVEIDEKPVASAPARAP